MTASPLAQTPNDIFNAPIAEADPEIAEVLNAELSRQQNGLEMIASENFVPRAVLQAQGSVLTNKYAEGYPGRRYYGGCEQVDKIETIARERAKSLFGAEYVNVQPHSGAQANAAVYQALVKPGDTVLDSTKEKKERVGKIFQMHADKENPVDAAEAEEAGRAACRAVLAGETGQMVAFRRVSSAPYRCETFLVPIEEVMLGERVLPAEYLTAGGTDVTEAFCGWCRPLLGPELPSMARLF